MSIPPPSSRPVQSTEEELRLSLFGSATSVPPPPPPPPRTSPVLQGEAFPPPAPPYQHFAASLGSSSPASGYYDHSSSSHDVHTHLLRGFSNLQQAPHASRATTMSINTLGISFALINAGVYFIQVCISIFLWLHDQNQNNGAVRFVRMIFVAVMYFVAALGFLLYGGRLFVMLKRVSSKSNGRNRKLFEVGIVMAICVTCSVIRSLLAYLSAFDADASHEILDEPMMNPYCYLLVEILPSVLLLFILRKLPPKRMSANDHPIN